MEAFGLKISKNDIKQIYRDLGKDFNENISYNEYLRIMISRLVFLLIKGRKKQ